MSIFITVNAIKATSGSALFDVHFLRGWISHPFRLKRSDEDEVHLHTEEFKKIITRGGSNITQIILTIQKKPLQLVLPFGYLYHLKSNCVNQIHTQCLFHLNATLHFPFSLTFLFAHPSHDTSSHLMCILAHHKLLHILSTSAAVQYMPVQKPITHFTLYHSLVSHVCNTALRSYQPIRSVMVLSVLLPWENNTLLQPDRAACHWCALREVRGHRACERWCQEDRYNRTKLEYNQRAEMIDDTARCTIYNTDGRRHFIRMTDHQMRKNGNANRS